MAIKTNTIPNLPFSALIALIVTSLLFIAIPLLTRISTGGKKTKNVQGVMIREYKPQPPPEPEKEERLEEQKKQEQPQKQEQREKMPQPKLNIPSSGLSAGMGTIAISGLLKSDFKVSDSLFVTAFNLNEVDQKPSVIRSVPPRYPFEAAQKGIEGRVTVRFVVDSTGQAQEPEISKVEPPEIAGIFEEAALVVIKKYKFKPAMKGGKAVDCIVNLPIKFSLTE